MWLTGLYLLAVVLANLSVAVFGPISTIANAFLFIGLDLTARDGLHERWSGKHLTRNMALLIAAGAVLSVLLNHNALRVAIASCVSFALSETADALVFQSLHRRAKLTRVNGSNIVSALVDSLAFPTIAFGAFIPWVIIGQFVAKTLGGAMWALILHKRMWRPRKLGEES